MLFEGARLEECFELFELVLNPSAASLIEARSVLINIYEVLLSQTAPIVERSEFFTRTLLPKLLESF